MISNSFFSNSEEYHVSSYQEMITLCDSLRRKEAIKPYTIYIDSDDSEINNLKFPFSYFKIVNSKQVLISKLYAKMKDKNNEELTTWKTAALKITGSHNIFVNLCVDNQSYNPEVNGQEVALGVYGDDNGFINCEFNSTQDTLFVGPLPDDLCTRYIDFLENDERYFDGNATNYFLNCTISGTVDFIFGAGKAIFDNCNLITVYDKRSTTYVVAPAHSLKDDFGYLFYQCHFIKGERVEEESTYLARPWRDYGKAVFAYCKYDNHIHKVGFSDWSDVNRTRTARFEEYPLSEGRKIIHNKKDSLLDDKYTQAVLKMREKLSL